MKRTIELKIIDINLEMQKLEAENILYFTTERWKILQAQREVLAEVLTA